MGKWSIVVFLAGGEGGGWWSNSRKNGCPLVPSNMVCCPKCSIFLVCWPYYGVQLCHGSAVIFFGFWSKKCHRWFRGTQWVYVEKTGHVPVYLLLPGCKHRRSRKNTIRYYRSAHIWIYNGNILVKFVCFCNVLLRFPVSPPTEAIAAKPETASPNKNRT